MSRCLIVYSGRGRLAAAVATYLQEKGVPVVGAVDRSTANRAALESLGIPVFSLEPTAEEWAGLCLDQQVALIALAGFLRPVPPDIVARYKGRIVNSHPALLPAFGGKGMYGRHVHEAVVREGAIESGFTVHEVTEAYDEGPVVYQLRLPIEGLSISEVEAFVQAVERELYPAIVWRLWVERVERRVF